MRENHTVKIVREKFVATLVVLAVLIPFITMIGSEIYFSLNRPVAIQTDNDLTVPIQITEGRGHKVTLFVTPAEAKWLHVVNWLTAVGAGIFVCYVIIAIVKKKRDTGEF